MPAPISIIIPVFNAVPVIGPALASLGPGLESGLIRELILADGGSADDIALVAELAGARLFTSAKGRGVQLAAGAARSKGEWLLFLHADTHLSPGWVSAVSAHMSGNPDDAGYFRLAYDASGLKPRLTSAWANLRSRAFGLPFGDQGLLIRRDIYDRAGGYAAIPLFEDADIALRLRGRMRELAAVATTSFARYERNGWLRQSWRNQRLLLRWLAGSDPVVLARDYS